MMSSSGLQHFLPHQPESKALNLAKGTARVFKLPPQKNLTAVDDWFITWSINKSEAHALHDWCQLHVANFVPCARQGGTMGEAATVAMGLPPSELQVLTLKSASSHPVFEYHQCLLQQLANSTGCTIQTAPASNRLLTNYYSWDTRVDLGSVIKQSFFTHKDANSIHFDLAKEKFRFAFSLGFFIANDVYQEADGRRLLFSKSSEDTSHVVYSPLPSDKLTAVIFPAYAWHGTEAWHLDRYDQAARVIQMAFKNRKSKEIKAEKADPLRQPFNTAWQQFANAGMADQEALYEQLMMIGEEKIQSDEKLSPVSREITALQKKIQLLAMLIGKVNALPEGSLQEELLDFAEENAEYLQTRLNKILTTKKFPSRLSVVWRGYASKENANSGQIAQLFCQAIGNSQFKLFGGKVVVDEHKSQENSNGCVLR